LAQLTSRQASVINEVFLCRLIYWAEADIIKSSLDDGSDIKILAKELGNITAIDISQGNFNAVSSLNDVVEYA